MKRFLLALSALLALAQGAYAFGDPLDRGDIYGSRSDKNTVRISGLNYVRCDNTADSWAGVQRAIDASCNKTLMFDNPVPCLNPGVSRTIISCPMKIVGTGAGLKWTDANARYLTVSGTTDVTIENLKIDGNAIAGGLIRTNFPAIGVYNSLRVDTKGNFISAVTGAGILYQNSKFGNVTENYISDTLADGIHITNGGGAGLTECRNITVANNHVFKPRDDAFATVSYYNATSLPCNTIKFLGNEVNSPTTRGFSNIGSKNVTAEVTIRDGIGLYAADIETDTSAGSFSPDGTKLDLLIINPSGTGVLIGRAANNTTGQIVISGTTPMTGDGVYVGSGSSVSLTTNTDLKVTMTGSGNNCVQVNGTANTRITGSISNCRAHGIVASGTNSNVNTQAIVVTNVGLASPSTYYGIFYNGVNGGSIVDYRIIDNQGTSTMLAPFALTGGSDKITIGSGLGVISNTVTTGSLFGTVSPTYFTAQHLRSVTGTFDPPSLATSAEASTTITVPGAVAGDVAVTSFSNALLGLTLTSEVTANDTVTVTFANPGTTTRDLASGTLRAFVFKRQ